MSKTLCDRCDSPRVVYFRLDMDWYDAGDVKRLNDPDDYLLGDPDEGDTLEIEDTYCIACGCFVSTHDAEPSERDVSTPIQTSTAKQKRKERIMATRKICDTCGHGIQTGYSTIGGNPGAVSVQCENWTLTDGDYCSPRCAVLGLGGNWPGDPDVSIPRVIARAKQEERERIAARLSMLRDSTRRAASDIKLSKAERARFEIRATTWDDACVEALHE